jgi:trigger factor
VKRTVRQECAFGCVICGLPLYEYDHIVPYAEVQEHRPENLVLLCPTHRGEKTRGLLSPGAVGDARKSPANARSGESAPYLLNYTGQHCRAILGSNVHEWPVLADGMFTVPLLIDDTPIVLFRAEDGQLLLTVQLLDSDNKLLVDRR